MSNQRLFRGKRVDGKGWVYGWNVEYEFNGVRFNVIVNEAVDQYLPLVKRMVSVIPESVGQSTGKKDTNNKDIYQGDIGKDGGVIVWSEDSAGFLYDHPDEAQDLYETQSWLEIVGNTIDKPELLEK